MMNKNEWRALEANPPGISWSTYGPVMVHLPFLKLTETAFGSHPHRIVSFTAVTRVQIPSGTPNPFNNLPTSAAFPTGTK